MDTFERSPVGPGTWRSEWNFRPAHSMFFSRARSSPETTALICGDHFQSYGEIACRACALSEQLTTAGVTRNKAVAVMMDSGWERVVALLGILAAGAGYLPVDPSLPRTLRQRLMREESSSLIVTQPWLKAHLAADEERPILTIEGGATSGGSRWRPRPSLRSHDLACACDGLSRDGHAIHRRIDHVGTSSEVLAVNQLNEVDDSDSLFELSAIDPMLSLYDPLGPLAVGGAIIVPTRDEVTHPAQWLDLIQDYAATIWSSTPAALQAMLDAASPGRLSALSSLRLVLLAEALPSHLARAAKRLVPQARFALSPASGGQRALGEHTLS
jgi:non-ribosomal peptide synthetase component F